MIDIIPFAPDRLSANAWGRDRASPWTQSNYSVLDICSTKTWPFADQEFALGLCSHTLEDLRDPLPALSELSRVCRKLLIITPSRLFEQTRNIDHPGYCGFSHHPWIVYSDAQGLVFRRKTAYLTFPGCHLWCPFGKTLPVDRGVFVYHGGPVQGRELAYWSAEEEVNDYRQFVQKQGLSRRLFIQNDRRPMTWKRRVYYFRQRYLGVT